MALQFLPCTVSMQVRMDCGGSPVITASPVLTRNRIARACDANGGQRARGVSVRREGAGHLSIRLALVRVQVICL